MTPNIDIFDYRVSPEPTSGCWLWLGAQNRGYGRVWLTLEGHKRKPLQAHRIAYETERGPIPDGLHLDHLCRNSFCVNPYHLEAVSNSENVRRGNPGIRQLEKTHCPQGHPYDGANTYTWHGQRQCRVCLRATRRRNRK